MKNFRHLQILNNRCIHSKKDSNSDQQNLLDALQKLKKPVLSKKSKLNKYQGMKITNKTGSNSDQQNLLDALQKLKKPAIFKETDLNKYLEMKIEKTEYTQYDFQEICKQTPNWWCPLTFVQYGTNITYLFLRLWENFVLFSKSSLLFHSFLILVNFPNFEIFFSFYKFISLTIKVIIKNSSVS